MYQVNATESRMEKILRLKEFEKQNKAQMNVMADIMGYKKHGGSDKDYLYKEFVNKDYLNKDLNHTQELQANERKNTRFVRLFLCVGLLVIFILDKYVFLQIPSEIYEDAKNLIQTDYSAGIIDFVKELSYTLDYEKISIK